MFEQLVECSSAKRSNRRRWLCFAGTALLWVLALTVVVVAGVFAYDGRLNDQLERVILVLPMPPPAAAPLLQQAREAQQTESERQPQDFEAQRRTPVGLPEPSPLSRVDAGIGTGNLGEHVVPGGDLIGVPDGVPHGVMGVPEGGRDVAEAPPPVRAAAREEQLAAPKQPQRSLLLQGSAVRRVEPVYPRLAIEARVSGQVVVEVVVDESGNVISARPISGQPLLRQAAITAAWGWRWNTTSLNGIPVKVVGTITFNFVL